MANGSEKPCCARCGAVLPSAALHQMFAQCLGCGFFSPRPVDPVETLAQPDDHVPFAIGTVLRERYRLDALLGVGAHGYTYRAEHLFLNHPCVVKVLPHRIADAGDAAVRRLRTEASAGFRVNDPCVVRVLDCDAMQDAWFFVMEYVAGRSAADLIACDATVPFEQVMQIAQDSVRGLAAIHSCRLLHRDVKPANLILGVDGRTRIADLGVVGVLREPGRGGERVPLGHAGTLAYIAPEMFQPQAPIDERSDLYSLGVSLYQLATRRLPFAESSFFRSLIDRQSKAAQWPTEAPEQPRWFVDAVLRLLAADPAARFRSCADLLDALSPHRARPLPSMPSAPTEIGSPSGVAVLVFENATGCDEDAWLGYALADHLARSLAQIPGVFVADRDELASVLDRRAPLVDAPVIQQTLDAARLIGASTVIEGRYWREEDRIRLEATARRSDGGPDASLRPIAGSLSSFVQLQDQLVRAAIEGLRLTSAPPGSAALPRPIAAQEAFFSGKRAYLRGDYERATESARRAAELDPEFAEALGFAGVCLSKMGRYADAEEYHSRQAALGQSRDEPREVVEAQSNIGAMHYFRGDYERAYASFALAAETARRHGMSVELAKISNNLGFVLFHLGRVEEAECAYEQAIETHRAHGALTSLIGPYNGMGNVRVRQGRHAEAAEYFRRALALAEESDDRVNSGICHMYLGRVAVQEGRLSDAKHELALALNILETTRFWNGLARVYESMAEMNLRLRNSTEALRCADKRIEVARRHANRRVEAAAWRQRAEACELAQRIDEARACRERAEQLQA